MTMTNWFGGLMGQDPSWVKYSLVFDIPLGEPKKADGLLELSVPVFGWTLFAESEEKLADKLNTAMNLFFDAYPRDKAGLDRIVSFFHRRGVKPQVTIEAKPLPWVGQVFQASTSGNQVFWNPDTRYLRAERSGALAVP